MVGNLTHENTTIEEEIDSADTRQLDEIVKEKLEAAYQKEYSYIDMHELAKITVEHSAIDLAYAVSHLPRYIRPVVYDTLVSREDKIAFLVNTDNDTRIVIFRYMNEKEMKQLFNAMSTDEIIRVMEDMSERRFRRMMEAIDVKKAKKINEINKHHRNSAGRLMTSDFFAFDMNMTIKQVSKYIRDFPRIDFVKGVYVVNQKKELIGYVHSRNLLINPFNTTLKRVMRPIVYKVKPEATRAEVVDIVEKYKLPSLPVVDHNHCLIGVIPNEDVIEAMEDLADSTIGRIGGSIETLSEPIIKRFFARSPWLFVTLLAGLINGGIMSAFEKQGGVVLTFVLFFVPLITGMSGNIGLQCSTVLVRNMALGVMSPRHKREAMIKELSIGLFCGVLFGVGVGMLMYFANMCFFDSTYLSPIALGSITGLGLVGACFAGTFLGVLSPIFFVRIGVDPAIAAGPVITAFNDFLSMSIYFVIAWSLARIFIG